MSVVCKIGYLWTDFQNVKYIFCNGIAWENFPPQCTGIHLLQINLKILLVIHYYFQINGILLV